MVKINIFSKNRVIGPKELNFLYWFVSKLPLKIIYFTYMHVMAHSTSGKYGNTHPDELSVMEALKRFCDDKKIKWG